MYANRRFSQAMRIQTRMAELADRGVTLDQSTELQCLSVIFPALRERLHGRATIVAEARPGEFWIEHGVKHNLVLRYKGQDYLLLVTVRSGVGGNRLQFNRGDLDLRHNTLEENALNRAVNQLLARR